MRGRQYDEGISRGTKRIHTGNGIFTEGKG